MPLRPEDSEPLLEVVPNIRSEHSDRNLPFHFDKLVHCHTSLHLRREFGKGMKKGKNHSSLLGGLVGKCRSIFFGYSHWSLTGRSSIMESTQRLSQVNMAEIKRIWSQNHNLSRKSICHVSLGEQNLRKTLWLRPKLVIARLSTESDSASSSFLLILLLICLIVTLHAKMYGEIYLLQTDLLLLVFYIFNKKLSCW